MRIVDLVADDPRRLAEVATLLLEGFAETGSTAWTTQDAARLEVEASLGDGRISRAAIDDTGRVVGF